MKKEVLRIERGTKRMGKSAGIQDFSIQIYRGEICGLLVENNLERKMLIRILSGEERLDRVYCCAVHNTACLSG